MRGLVQPPSEGRVTPSLTFCPWRRCLVQFVERGILIGSCAGQDPTALVSLCGQAAAAQISWRVDGTALRSLPWRCLYSLALTDFARRTPSPPSLPSRECRRRLSFRFVRATAAVRDDKGGTAVVWFKRDLRLDDHPGLVAAASRHRAVVPLYVFDPRILRFFADDVLEVLLSALEDLRKELRDQGSDLLIAFGSAEDEILKLLNKVNATHIFAEEEVEHNFRQVITRVKSSLSAVPFSSGSPEFISWNTPFYSIQNAKEFPMSYREFQKLRIPVTSPATPPTLPVLDMELQRGYIPTLGHLKEYLHGNCLTLDSNWTSFKKISARMILSQRRISQSQEPSAKIEDLGKLYPGENKSTYSPSIMSQTRKLGNSVFVSRESNIVKGGTNVVLNALAAYLRYLEGTARDDWQEVHEKVLFTERRRGASFGALFGTVLYLGIVSRRRVHYEAIKYEKDRNAGFLSPFGFSVATVAAAVDATMSMEWYWLLSLKSQTHQGCHPVKVWSWSGYLIQYTVVGNEGPAVLLVHGFGAFLEHYRDNISAIANDGHRVWAITLLGFGKSEKPNVRYTELLWAELLRDFIVDVIGEPVHLIGNSIGGYFVAAVAGLWPSLVKTAILMNSAGSVIPGYMSVSLTNTGTSSGVAGIGAQILLLFLRLRIEKILRKYYPSNPVRADKMLINEMLRASDDPGVLTVLESVFDFSLSMPLNYLLESFGGKVLVIQGMKDPLSKSKKKLDMLRKHCDRVIIKELDAGHCPHDECPQLVNSIISEWIKASS